MQLLKRSSNGNYSKLLEGNIQTYLKSKNRFQTVRGLIKAVIATTQLATFFDIEIPTRGKKENESSWISILRDAKPKTMRNNGIFTELDLVAYLSGAIDCMLELPRDYDLLYKEYTKMVDKQSADFLILLQEIGYTRQLNQIQSK